MNNLLNNTSGQNALVPVKITGTVEHKKAYHGPNSRLSVSSEQADAWKAANVAVDDVPSDDSQQDTPDLNDSVVRDVVMQAMRKLPKDADHFTNGGKPEIKPLISALETILPGLEMSAAERDALWADAQKPAG